MAGLIHYIVSTMQIKRDMSITSVVRLQQRKSLQFYSHAVSQDRMAAAGEMLTAILSHESGLRAD